MTTAPCEGRARRAGEDARLLAPALVAWAAVAALLGASPRLVLGAAAITATLGLVALVRSRGLIALVLLVLAVTLGAAAARGAAREAGPVEELAREGGRAELVGVLAGEPRLRPARNAGEGRDLVIARVEVRQVASGGTVREVDTPVLVLADRSWAERHWREQVRFRARLAEAEPGRDVVAIARVSESSTVLAPAPMPWRWAAAFRAGLVSTCAQLPGDAAGLVPGMAVGETEAVPQELDAAMKETSLSHLSAVSGSNIALVVGAVVLLSSSAGLPRRVRPVIAAVALLGYVLVCGPEPSVIRAGVMGGVGLLAISGSRRRAALPGLSTAIIVLLCLDPWLARSAGFAMSCLATLGLVVLARPWAEVMGRRLPERLGWLGTACAVPAAAQLACAPVVVLLSGRVSVVAVLANLLVAPLVGPVTVLGLASAVLSPVPGLAGWSAWAAALPAMVIAQVARRGADLPWTSIPWPATWWGALALGGLVLAVLLSAPWWVGRARRHPIAAALLVTLLVALSVPLGRLTWPPDRWQVTFCDVGQGDATVLATQEPGTAVLMDTGPPDGKVVRCLRRLGVRRLRALVVTHFHDDHAGAAEEVLRALPTQEVLVTALDEPAGEARAVRSAAARAGALVRVVTAGDQLEAPGLRISVLGPTRVRSGESGINDASLVLAVTSGAVRVLITGDVERQGAQDALPALRAEVVAHGRFDVLKVPHHASRTQDPSFLAAGRAGLAVVSVGADNDFGHPHERTLAMLGRLGMAIERTDQHGDLAVLPDGRVVRQRRRGRGRAGTCRLRPAS